jgi:hypothetical protein
MSIMKLILAAMLFGAALHAEYLFASFRDPGSSGVWFAISDDGYHWQLLNDGKPWLPPSHAGELMRDPFITRGPDREFHMVWTWEWRVKSIGYAHSKDLVHWSEQKSKWLVIWSSVVDGKHEGNRIYSAIDATILRTGSKYYLVFKDERKEPLKKFMQIASGASFEGPWSEISEPFTESWSEGPSATKIGNKYMCITIIIEIRSGCRQCSRGI